MTILFAIIVVFWWIAIWGIFDIYTEHKTRDEKLKIYAVMLGIILVIVCFFPTLMYRF
jgi:hypothetical protein